MSHFHAILEARREFFLSFRSGLQSPDPSSPIRPARTQSPIPASPSRPLGTRSRVPVLTGRVPADSQFPP